MNTFCFSHLRKRTMQAFALVLVAFPLANAEAFAQTSPSARTSNQRISLEVVQPSVGKGVESLITNGTSGSIPILYIRERNVSLFRRDSAFQNGAISIRRTAGASTDEQVVVAYAVEYVDSLGRPLPDISATSVLVTIACWCACFAAVSGIVAHWYQ
jgi:hypothetical protein